MMNIKNLPSPNVITKSAYSYNEKWNSREFPNYGLSIDMISKSLKEFGGQSNTFKVHPTMFKGKSIELVEIESAGSGQGTVEATKSLVYLSQWNAKLITEVQESSNAGRYDEKLGAEDCRTGRDNSGYLNVMPYSPYVIRTTVTGDACNNKPQGYKVSSKLIPVVINEIK
jgi:hypothetical protein